MAISFSLYDLIKQGEGQELDFKLSITSLPKIARTLVAFANSAGGRLVVGVDNSGEVIGVDAEQEKFMLIQAAKKYCEPAIYIHFTTMEQQGKTVLIAEIKPGKGEYRALNENGDWLCYVRVADQTVLVPDAFGQAAADKYNLKPIPILLEENQGLVAFLEKNTFITVKEYMQMMDIPYTIARRSLHDLYKHGVLGVEYINNVPHYFLSHKRI
ncbi:MAG: hypothetical protein KatS3mg031_0636 [Chitinophagales bacterium]|nr:MAG: hypothetical protein KatS3mg031_0636 [Chitinophagales bacterium]